MIKPEHVKRKKTNSLFNFLGVVSVAAAALMISLFAIEFLPGLVAPKLSAAPQIPEMLMYDAMRDVVTTSEPLILWNGVTGVEKVYGMGGGPGIGGGLGGGSDQPYLSIDPPTIIASLPAISENVSAEEVVVEEFTVEPPESAEHQAAEEETTLEPTTEQPETTFEENLELSVQPVANPIIGIRPVEEWGQEINPRGIAESVQEEPALKPFPWLLISTAGLGFVAITAAIFAFVVRRRL